MFEIELLIFVGHIIKGLISVGGWLFGLLFITFALFNFLFKEGKAQKGKDQNRQTVEDAIELKKWETYRENTKYKPKATDYDPAAWKEKNHEANQYGQGEITRIKKNHLRAENVQVKPEDVWETYNTVGTYGKGEVTRIKRNHYQNRPFKKPEAQPEPAAPEPPKSIVWDKAFLMSIEWKLFEDICVEYLKTRRCNAQVTNLGKDDGIDLKVFNPEGKLMFIGQCKAWNRPIDVKEIRELYGIMAAENVNDGFYITTSTFTQVAREFKQGKRILLIDGNECVKRFNELDDESKTRINHLLEGSDFTIPTCVSCGLKMVKRVSQKPYNKGQEFWGCTNYPRCKNILKVRKYYANNN